MEVWDDTELIQAWDQALSHPTNSNARDSPLRRNRTRGYPRKSNTTENAKDKDIGVDTGTGTGMGMGIGSKEQDRRNAFLAKKPMRRGMDVDDVKSEGVSYDQVPPPPVPPPLSQLVDAGGRGMGAEEMMGLLKDWYVSGYRAGYMHGYAYACASGLGLGEYGDGGEGQDHEQPPHPPPPPQQQQGIWEEHKEQE